MSKNLYMYGAGSYLGNFLCLKPGVVYELTDEDLDSMSEASRDKLVKVNSVADARKKMDDKNIELGDPYLLTHKTPKEIKLEEIQAKLAAKEKVEKPDKGDK